jgi:hypothetical protein
MIYWFYGASYSGPFGGSYNRMVSSPKRVAKIFPSREQMVKVVSRQGFLGSRNVGAPTPPIAFSLPAMDKNSLPPKAAPFFHSELKSARFHTPSVNPSLGQVDIGFILPDSGEADDHSPARDVFAFGLPTAAVIIFNPYDSHRQIIRPVGYSPANILGQDRMTGGVGFRIRSRVRFGIQAE